VAVGNRTPIIGQVYPVHHAAVPTNPNEAVAALNSAESKGVQVHYRPGDDPFFYLSLADVPADEVFNKVVAEWSLIGVDQPGLPKARHRRRRF
jgi:hypothetical protein